MLPQQVAASLAVANKPGDQQAQEVLDRFISAPLSLVFSVTIPKPALVTVRWPTTPIFLILSSRPFTLPPRTKSARPWNANLMAFTVFPSKLRKVSIAISLLSELSLMH